MKTVCIYKNISLSGKFTKSNCPAGGRVESVLYTVPPGKFSSTISLNDANRQAQNDINANGQTFANQTGVCYYLNIELSNIFSKNDCVTGGNPTAVLFTVPAGKYTSTVSQADANSKAQIELNTNGQTNANSKGNCVFRSSSLDNRSYWKNNCSSGRGSEVKYTSPIGAYTSTISQADANAKVFAAGQENANRLGTCNNMPSTPRY